MIVDLLCVGVVALFALLGYFSGFLAQFARLIALAAAYVVARPLGELLIGPVSATFRLPRLTGRIVAAAVAFLLAYALLATLVMFLLRTWRRRRPHTRSVLDSVVGALFGGAKGLFLVFVLLCALTLVDHGPLAPQLARVDWKGSWAAGRAREHNVLEEVKIPVAGNLRTLRRLGTDRRLQRRVARDPAVMRLLAHPKVRRLMADKKLMAAARRGELSKVLADPRVEAALRDPQLRALIKKIDISKLKAVQAQLKHPPKTSR